MWLQDKDEEEGERQDERVQRDHREKRDAAQQAEGKVRAPAAENVL